VLSSSSKTYLPLELHLSATIAGCGIPPPGNGGLSDISSRFEIKAICREREREIVREHNGRNESAEEGLSEEQPAEDFTRTWRDKVGLFMIVVGSVGILVAVETVRNAHDAAFTGKNKGAAQADTG